jgi:hypothetical protein
MILVFLAKISCLFIFYVGGRGGTLVKVVCYKSEGRWFDSRWCNWKFFIDIILPIALGSTQPLTEMSTRTVRKADNLTTILCRCHVIWEL